MNLLFLHPNFPGQFKHLARAAARQKNQVKFLCQTHYGRVIEGVERLTLKKEASHEALESLKPSILDRSQIVAEQYRKGLVQIKKSGWIPDLVVSHSGWGCGLHVKELWPNTKFIAYLEWWFDPSSSFFHHDEANQFLGINSNSITKCWLRNQHVALELATADQIVCPTSWQKNQLPLIFKEKCNEIFDGVDLKTFNPDEDLYQKAKKDSDNIVVTYGTRGMDPMRGFPQLIKAIPEMIRTNPRIRLEIAGDTSTYYGSEYPVKGVSWKDWAEKYLEENNIANRVKWVGKLNPPKYENWLKTSSCHIYLTHPFIVSWSLIEAYCCGTPLIISDVEPTKDICGDDCASFFVDHRSEAFLDARVTDKIEEFSRINRAELAIQRNRQRFSVETALKAWEVVAGLEVTTND